MKKFEDNINDSLMTGFIDRAHPSDNSFQPKILLNNSSAGKKVLSSLIKELSECRSFKLAIAFITNSGIATLINTLLDLERRGVQGQIIVSQYLNFTQPGALETLIKFKNIQTRIMTHGSFHSKGYIFDRGTYYNIIIGSSNLTANALCSNIELNIKTSASNKSTLALDVIQEFDNKFSKATVVDSAYIEDYKKLYDAIRHTEIKVANSSQKNTSDIRPNSMQTEALENLKNLRFSGEEKALIISATGTGKTYLAALDAKQFNAKKVLFVVHRATIAKNALESFSNVFGSERTYGLYSGQDKESSSDFIFSTVQTISRAEHRNIFSKTYFDYIIIDESHRAGAETYDSVLSYFIPKFVLGMTATPERTDGFDIFSLFDHNIAHEIRLHDAMKSDLLCPFHYYGVTDLTINETIVAENTEFNLLIAEERVNKIIEATKLYKCDDGEVRGLVFCSRTAECSELSRLFNANGYRTISLSGLDSETVRENAISRLETDNLEDKLDYIFTVDIFNEGIDIPRINQIIMLRPTQSAIVFVQQLGRGLRKQKNKEYLTVLDFIGNYQNTYLVPIALYGDNTYTKDTIRKMMAGGSDLIPGSSTINFDKVSSQRIYESINSSNLHRLKDLKKDYNLLKYKLGRIPLMVDFLEHGSRDPMQYVLSIKKSYLNFVTYVEGEENYSIAERDRKIVELLSREVNNSKRVEESIILQELLINESYDVEHIRSIIFQKYNYRPQRNTIAAAVHNINFKFAVKPDHDCYGLEIVSLIDNKISAGTELKNLLRDQLLSTFLRDSITYGVTAFDKNFKTELFEDGFIRYQKYSRKDVFRILNWDQNPNPQNVGGYMKSKDGSNCAIFVTYEKEEDITATTMYDDHFVSHDEFSWMSKNRRNLNSPDIQSIRNHQDFMRMPLFVKKSNDEGHDFYYIGNMIPFNDGFEETTMPDDDGNDVSVVKVKFKLQAPVAESIYDYLTTQ